MHGVKNIYKLLKKTVCGKNIYIQNVGDVYIIGTQHDCITCKAELILQNEKIFK